MAGVEPPDELIRPEVPLTAVTAEALDMAIHVEPVYTYIVLVLELK
jgi:hypothetical protein